MTDDLSYTSPQIQGLLYRGSGNGNSCSQEQNSLVVSRQAVFEGVVRMHRGFRPQQVAPSDVHSVKLFHVVLGECKIPNLPEQNSYKKKYYLKQSQIK